MPKPENYPPFAAHFDANQVPSVMGVVGTLGTSDTGGTAQPLPVGVNAATGAMYVQDLSGASGTTTVQMVSGTLNVGTVVIPSGTINVGTVVVPSGTINVGTFVMPSGTLNVGTVVANGGTIQNLATGTINALASGTITGGTLQNLVSGTINALASGTITGGTLQNLVSGTLNALAAGTITGGTLTNLVSGTINALAAGTITAGTVSIATGTVVGKEVSGAAKVGVGILAAGTDSGGTIYYPLTDATGVQRSSGSAVMTVGTLTTGTLQNLISGTVNALAAGTITAGTVQVSAGTMMGTWIQFTGSATAGTTDILASTDVSNYKTISVQLFNTFVGTVELDGSNDNTNFVRIGVSDLPTTQFGPLSIMTTAGIYSAPINSRFIRVRMMAFTSGTAQGNIQLYSLPVAPQAYQSANMIYGGTQQTLGTVGVVNGGTITVGSIANGMKILVNGDNAGTAVYVAPGGGAIWETLPTAKGTSLVTVGTTGAAVWGTLVAAAGAGTKQYVSRVSIIVTSGTVDVAVANGIGGSAGAGVFERGAFPPGGGITNNYFPVQTTGTNGTLAYWLGGAGTVAITVNYWQAV